jgi:serine/threonine-protein phosphatase 2A regulatory subunit B'
MSATADAPKLFKKKLRQASVTFDFRQSSQLIEKQVKIHNLIDIGEYVGLKGSLQLDVLDPLMRMVESNLFRPLYPSAMPIDIEYDPEEDDPTLDPNWPHLELVYEILAKVLVSPDLNPNVARGFASKSFLRRMFDLLDSEDPRERVNIKICLHAIYSRWSKARPEFRREVVRFFQQVALAGELHLGVSEVLDILGSIINGFVSPLKEEHREFLMTAFMPLHRVKYLRAFHANLVICIVQFVTKDIALAEPVIRGILSRWASTDNHNGGLLVTELESILELINPTIFRNIAKPLMRRLAICLSSGSLSLIEKTLALLANKSVRALMEYRGNMAIIVPIICRPLVNIASGHWHKGASANASYILKYFVENGGEAYKSFASLNKIETSSLEKKVLEREAGWIAINEQALRNNHEFRPPPYYDHPKCGRKIYRRASDNLSGSLTPIDTDPRYFTGFRSPSPLSESGAGDSGSSLGDSISSQMSRKLSDSLKSVGLESPGGSGSGLHTLGESLHQGRIRKRRDTGGLAHPTTPK